LAAWNQGTQEVGNYEESHGIFLSTDGQNLPEKCMGQVNTIKILEKNGKTGAGQVFWKREGPVAPHGGETIGQSGNTLEKLGSRN